MKLISQIVAVAAVATLVVPAFAQTSTMSKTHMSHHAMKKMVMHDHKMIMNNRMMIKHNHHMMHRMMRHEGMTHKGMMMHSGTMMHKGAMMHSGTMMHSTTKPMTKTTM